MRSVIRALLVLVVLGVVGFIFLGYWTGTSMRTAPSQAPSAAVGTSGAVDIEKARERGAALGEKTAVAANRVKETVTEAAITTKIKAKIKAKMALDDSVKARAIDVSTSRSTVTLSAEFHNYSDVLNEATEAQSHRGDRQIGRAHV